MSHENAKKPYAIDGGKPGVTPVAGHEATSPEAIDSIFSEIAGRGFSGLLREALECGYLSLPAPEGTGRNICRASRYIDSNNIGSNNIDSNNVLKFSGATDFYIVQHNRFCEALFIPSRKEAFGKKRWLDEHADFMPVKLAPSALEAFRDGAFSGVLNGYSRPFHYFYDRMYPLIEALPQLPGDCVIPVNNIKGSFIDLETIDGRFKNMPQGETNEAQGFFLSPTKSEDNQRTPPAFFRKLTPAVTGDYACPYLEEVKEDSTVIWLGMALEKRKWTQRTAAYLAVVEEALALYENPVFVVDGLTSEFSADPAILRSGASLQEVENFDLLRRLLNGRAVIIDLIGAQARDKISVAGRVDFFISNRLTDSMWCAAMNFAPGFTYSSNGSIGRGSAVHPLTHTLPDEHVVNLGQEGIEYDCQDMSINAWLFSSMAVDSMQTTIAMNRRIKKALSGAPDAKGKISAEVDIVPQILKTYGLCKQITVKYNARLRRKNVCRFTLTFVTRSRPQGVAVDLSSTTNSHALPEDTILVKLKMEGPAEHIEAVKVAVLFH